MPAGSRGPLLLRLPNWLGDLVLALPVIRAAASGARPLLLVGPAPFEALLLPRVPGARYLAWTRASRYALVAPLRRARAGTALLLTESFSSALLAALAGIPERIGFAGEGRSPLLTVRVARPLPARSTRRATEYRRLASAAGFEVREEAEEPALLATGPELDAAARLLASLGRRGAPYAVIAPGASYGHAKRWAPERFAEAARHLREGRGLATVLVGAGEDREAADGVAVLEPRVASAVGRTDLPALAGLLAGAAVVLSNDSGVMHLAAALRRPTVAIFGSTSPIWTSASAPWVTNLYAGYPCSPCFRRTCSIGYGCLRSVTAADVAAALDGALRGESAVRRVG